jgi:hypothetical protein
MGKIGWERTALGSPVVPELKQSKAQRASLDSSTPILQGATLP